MKKIFLLYININNIYQDSTGAFVAPSFALLEASTGEKECVLCVVDNCWFNFNNNRFYFVYVGFSLLNPKDLKDFEIQFKKYP